MADESKKPEMSDEKKKRLIKKVVDAKKDSITHYKDKFKEFQLYDILYMAGVTKSNVPYGRANLGLPLAFQQIEPFVCQMSETMVGEAPYIAYEGRGPEDDEMAQEITEFTQYQLDNADFVVEYTKYLRNVGKYGTGQSKLVWETESFEIEEEKEQPIDLGMVSPELAMEAALNPPMETVTENVLVTMHDGPRFYNLSIYDCFIPPSAASPDVQSMEYFIHRAYRTPKQVLRNSNYKMAHAEIERILEEEKNSEEEGTEYNKAALPQPEPLDPAERRDKYKGQFEILEYWGHRDDTPEEQLIVVGLYCGHEILLRAEKNPLKYKFKPFLMSNDYPVEGEAYGLGEILHIKDLIKESTALRNARLDVVNTSLNGMWLVERQSGVNTRELYNAPNKIILTNDLNGIKRLETSGANQTSYTELGQIDFDIQNTTEIINPRQDVSRVGGAFGGTATGVNFLAAKANLRLKQKAMIQEQQFFKPLARMLNWYNRQFTTDEQYYRVANNEDASPYRTLPEDAFLTDVDFKPTSQPEKLSISERRENLGYMFQTIGQIEKVAPGSINMQAFVKEGLKLYGFSHPDKYINQQGKVVYQTPQGLVDERGQPVQVMQAPEQQQPQ